MDQHIDVFVGIDVAKSRNAIAIADSERGGEVRYFGEVDGIHPVKLAITHLQGEKPEIRDAPSTSVGL
jgi:hypothetical protein